MLDTAHTPKSFSLLHSGLTGDKFNTSYAREVTMTGEADLIEAWTWVNANAILEGNIRNNAVFVWSDCVVMDMITTTQKTSMPGLTRKGLLSS